jgi:hypothetical protein
MLGGNALALASIEAQSPPTPRFTVSTSISNASGDLALRGVQGGSVSVAWRLGDARRKIFLQPEAGVHVFRRLASADQRGFTSLTPYLPAMGLLVHVRQTPGRIGIYGLAGPVALGSYGPIVWGLGGTAGVGVRPRGGRLGIEGRITGARVPSPEPGFTKFFDARFVSLGATLRR